MSSRVAPRLLAWHARYGRHDLPWQHDPSPYRVWVSEIMLQQTQVGTVKAYFDPFMHRFPDVVALAAAEVDEVLHRWSGLGYYARARNLHRAARLVCERHGGELPGEVEALRDLPGIGPLDRGGHPRALAGVSATPFSTPTWERVLCRYHAIGEWPGPAAVRKRLWALAERHTPRNGVAAYTQAIMDLGATLCTRRRPVCALCPLEEDCRAPRRRTPARAAGPRVRSATGRNAAPCS